MEAASQPQADRTSPSSDSDDEKDAKRQKLNTAAKNCVAARRDIGLLWVTVVERKWLRCKVKCVENADVQDSKQRSTVKYVDANDKELKNSDPSINWQCSPCSDRYALAVEEGSTRPSMPDAFTRGGRDHQGMREKAKLNAHERTSWHQESVNPKQPVIPKANVKGQAAAPNAKQGKLSIMLAPSRRLQANYLLGLIWIVLTETAVALMSELRNLAVAWGVPMSAAMSWYVHLELIAATAEFFRRLQRARLALVSMFSALGDGSTDISDKEAEVVGARYTWRGKGRNEFVELTELDLTKSRDGKSPDAKCLEAAYDKVFTKVFAATTGILKLDKVRDKDGPVDWIRRCYTCSLDGASVNTGEMNGLIGLWHLRAPWIVLTHGLAHVVELKAKAALKAVDYFANNLDAVCRGVVSTYNQSGKKQWNCKRIAEELGEDKHLKLAKFCHTRYERALARALKALMTNWRATAVHLHELAHEQVCTTKEERATSLTLSSPLESFIGREYSQEFEGFDREYTIKLTGVIPADGVENELDRPRLEASITPATRGYSQPPLYKSQVIDQLDSALQAKLDANPSYQLYNNLTTARFVKSALFLQDAREPVARLSELTQRDHLNLNSYDRKRESVIEDIQEMEGKPGANETKFVEGYNAGSEIFRGIQVLNQGLDEFESDRKQYLQALSEQLQDPELQLDDPLSRARRRLFSYETWPSKVDMPLDYFDDSLTAILEHFKIGFVDTFGENVLFKLKKQCREAVKFVQNLPESIKFADRWSRVVLNEDIGIVAKFLIELELQWAMDTAACERWFSLMNRLKDKKRNRMCMSLLNDLMFICLHAPRSFEELKLVLGDILDIWESESKRGRYSAAWRQEVDPIIEDLKHAQEIESEIMARKFDLDTIESLTTMVDSGDLNLVEIE